MENSQAIDLTAKPFRVGHWLVTPDRHEWHCEGDVRRVPPRLMLLLRCLARAAGSTVSREILLESVWERRVLNDEVLSRSIADLRQALDDDAREPRFVQTIPKLGYRLIAEVEFGLDVTPNSTATEGPQNLALNLAAEIPARSSPSVLNAVPKLKPKSMPKLALMGLVSVLALTALALITTANLDVQSAAKPEASNPAPSAPSAAELLLARPLTSAQSLEFSPRFSKDGLWLAYAIANPPEPGSQLVLRSRDGSTQRQFTQTKDAEDVCPVFVGQDLIWTRHSQGRCELMKQALLGDTPQGLAACAALRSCPDISSDGNQLLYTARATDDRHGNGLAVLNLRSGESAPLTAPTLSEGDDIDPRFSPHGTVSYVRGAIGTQSLWQVALTANAKPRRAALVDSMIFGHAYLPDGRLLVASDALGFRALLKFAPDALAGSHNPELIGARGARYPDVAMDGSVVYELASYDANLWLYRANAKPQRLTPSSRYEGYPIISPDAKTLLYQSNQHGLEAIYSINLDSGKPSSVEHKLTLDAGDRWAHPAFKRTSKALWLTRYGEKHTEVWQYLPGAQSAQRAPGFPLGAHDVSDDAQSDDVWFLLGDTPPIKLMRRAKANDAPMELVANDVLSYRTDARGLFLVYQTKQDQLWHCPQAPDMRSCVQLAIQIAPGYARNWTLSDHALYFVGKTTHGDANRWSSRFDFATKKITLLDVPAPSTLSHGLAVARDESVIIVAQLDGLAIDLYWWLAPSHPQVQDSPAPNSK